MLFDLVVGNILVIFGMAIVFILLGLELIFVIFGEQLFFKNVWFRVGLAFFLGLSSFLIFWKILSIIIFNVQISLYITTIVSLVIILLSRKKFKQYNFNNFKKIICGSILLIVFIFIHVIYSLRPMPDVLMSNLSKTMPAYGFAAVVHSFRAGNIAVYIAENNFIPRITQNFGQSLLSTIPSFFGFPSPQLSLVVWLTICIFFLSLIIFVLIDHFVHNKLFSLGGTIIAMIANSALSWSYVEVVDTGSTNFLITNSDTIIGFILLLVFVFSASFFCNSYKFLDKKRCLYYILTIILISSVWNLVGAHNIILALISLIILFFFINEPLYYRFKVCFWLFGSLLVGSVIGMVIFGGMYLPYKFSDKVAVPGVMSVIPMDINVPVVEIRPKMFLMNYDSVNRAVKVLGLIKNKFYGQNTLLKIKDNVADVEIVSDARVLPSNFQVRKLLLGFLSLFKSGGMLRWMVFLIIIYFPLLGYTLSFFVVLKNKLPLFNEDNYQEIIFLKLLWFTGVVLFGFGFYCSAFVVLFGKEIEMSRFMGFGNFLGLFFLGLVASVFIKERNKINLIYKIILFVVLTFSLVGPILNYGVVGIVGNFVLPADVDTKIFSLPEGSTYRTLRIDERLRALININTMIGTDFHLD